MAGEGQGGFDQGRSITRPPLFVGDNFMHWKSLMQMFIIDQDLELWHIIVRGPNIPQQDGPNNTRVNKAEAEFTQDDLDSVAKNYKAINLLYCGLSTNEFNRISSCRSAKEIWDKLVVTYEGTSQVKETKISIFLRQYELFKMNPDESVKVMFTRFTEIVNNLDSLGKTFENEEKSFHTLFIPPLLEYLSAYSVLHGELVAVKRLTNYTEQGIREFKTEIGVVAKLQHKNLVKLKGYCVEHEERILIYEFMPNLSLDKILFDATKSISLDWRTRYKIIEGIACGLQYLHESLISIVHRDLKSSNILLDEEMNPKIADFGLAKLFNIDETTGNTTKVAGTFGYMAPEYAMAGRYSMKSDIYSFGVILLEVLSGISVFHFYDTVTGNGLLLHAWRLWNERTIEVLIDPILKNKYSKTEVERCAQIGLLCVQDDIARRPTIRALISMLENQSLELPYPDPPSTFFQGSFHTTSRTSHSQGEIQTQSSQIEYQLSTTSSLYTQDLNPR